MRFGATQLESFRLFMEPDQEWMSMDDILATFRGAFIPTRPVQLGQAFGRILESPDRYAVNGGYRYHCDGVAFDFGRDVMAEPLALVSRCGVFEAKAVQPYGPHEVATRADYISGAHLFEFKTTLGSFDFDKYAQSYQWRYMVDAFRPNRVTYRVFLLSDSPNGVIGLRGIESFDLYPYAALHQDCASLVEQAAAFATAAGVADVLNQRQRDA